MSSSINTQATTFWNFINKHDVEIPIIQRDYAQGRLGKETLRKSFLRDLKNALDNGEIMKLDFVYGSTENGKLNPLDGQQRLTTLWLLHWYIALRAGELNETTCAVFKKFTYETRISSRDFCDNLCISEHFEKYKEKGISIVDFITNQTWFYYAWKQDPTIQSMLRMLGGTKIADKNGDDIEEIFQRTSKDGFKSYWEKLTNEEIIIFYHLPLKDFGLSDDLYIKMNARGKQLTSFENFKADLIGYITKQSGDESLEKNEQKYWEELLDTKNGIPIMLDTNWTDIFWESKSIDYKIDEIYFAFINRFFLQELICARTEKNGYVYSVKDLEEKNSTFRFLYGNTSDDSQLQYSGIEKYFLDDDKKIPLSFFKSIRDTLNKVRPDYKLYINNYFPAWVNSDFEYIPKYKEDGKITTLGQKERVVFLSICRYYEKGAFERSSFEQWMRVVWNIVENSGIENISAMIGAMRLIDELSIQSHNIYEFLSNSQSQIKSDFAKEQVLEEIDKAKQIINNDCVSYKKYGKNENRTWKDAIIEAEKLFKGAIRFLYTDGEGQTNWCNFNTKWFNAQKYFDETGVKDTEEKKFKTEAILLKAVLYHVHDFWRLIEPQKSVFDNEFETWKSNILLNKNWENAVHQLMMGNIDVSYRNDDCLMYRNIYGSTLLNYVSNNLKGARIRWIHNHRALYPPRYEGIILDDDQTDPPFYRNKILTTLCKNKVIEIENKIEGCDFLKGWDIVFTLGDFKYQWNTDGNIYVYEDGILKKKPDDSYFSFSVNGIDGDECFLKKLGELEKQIKTTIADTPILP